MYNEFYGFSEKPFLLRPDPNYLFLSPSHKKALTYLEYGFMEAISIVLLTGEVGTGKTTLLSHIRRRYGDILKTAFISNTNITPTELLELILREFGIEQRSQGKPQCLELLRQYFNDLDKSDKKALLIVDDAQNLSIEALEEIRMLFSLEEEPHTGLQVLLVGQSELREKLQSPKLLSLAQRVGVNFHLPPLEPQEVIDYIDHRIQKVGGPRNLFDRKALARIAIAAGGIPRAINQLCDAALVYGYGYNQKNIGVPIIEKVIAERSGFGLAPGKDKNPLSSAETMTSPTASLNQSTLQTLQDRIQALERGIVALTAGMGKIGDEKASDDSTIELKRRLTFTKKRLAEERFRRLELADEIKALKRVFESAKTEEEIQTPTTTNIHELPRKKPA
jgi:general secretion pathway protein A